ncbi:MAG TPA: threonine/serine dehydratase [Chloroflexota bacterium]
MGQVGIEDVRTAAARIGPYVRRTPLLAAQRARGGPASGALTLKLESLQVTGSFKARGAVNTLLSLSPEQVARGLVTASGGNHGLGVAYAGYLAGTPATVYLPRNTPPAKAEKLAGWGARVVVEGEVWDDANRLALAAAEREGLTYVHPFADRRVIAGQGTVALELLEQDPSTRLILVAIGGGGLIAGVALTAKALDPTIRIVGVEPTGAPTLHDSLLAGRLVELPRIATDANTLAPRRSAELNLDLIRTHVDEIVLVEDEEMRAAARWLWTELGVAAELSGAAAVAAWLSGRVALPPDGPACALVCGAGTDGLGKGFAQSHVKGPAARKSTRTRGLRAV